MDSDEKSAPRTREFFARRVRQDDFERYVSRIFTPTAIAGVFSISASLLSNRVDPGKVLGHTVAYTCACEFVRFIRVGDPDDLLNSIVGGLGGGACHGFLHYRRIGLAGVGCYAAMYSVVGTAVDYATSGLRSALDRQMDAELAARRNYWKEVNKRQHEEGRREPPLTGIATLEDNAFLRSFCRGYIPSFFAGFFCDLAHILSKGKIPVDFMTAFRHTAAYIGGRELVRLMRAGDQDDLLNSIVGGLVGGACHGFLHYRRIGLAGVGRYAAIYSVVGTAADYATSDIRSAFDRSMIGLAGVGRYAAMYSVVGTAVDYATSGLRSALDRQMDAEYAAARKAALSRREEGRSEPPLTGIGTVKDDAFLRSCCRVYFPSLLAGLFCEPAHILSKGKIPVDFFTAFRHTAAYIGGRELVRLMRAGDQDDLLNSIVGGLVGGACHGLFHYRRIGLAGVGRYAAIYSVVGTAADYATSDIRSAFDRSMIGEFDLQGYILERVFNIKLPDGGSEGCSVCRDDE